MQNFRLNNGFPCRVNRSFLKLCTMKSVGDFCNASEASQAKVIANNKYNPHKNSCLVKHPSL